MKKFHLGLLILTLTAVMLTGCGTPKSPLAGKVLSDADVDLYFAPMGIFKYSECNGGDILAEGIWKYDAESGAVTLADTEGYTAEFTFDAKTKIFSGENLSNLFDFEDASQLTFTDAPVKESPLAGKYFKAEIEDSDDEAFIYVTKDGLAVVNREDEFTYVMFADYNNRTSTLTLKNYSHEYKVKADGEKLSFTLDNYWEDEVTGTVAADPFAENKILAGSVYTATEDVLQFTFLEDNLVIFEVAGAPMLGFYVVSVADNELAIVIEGEELVMKFDAKNKTFSYEGVTFNLKK